MITHHFNREKALEVLVYVSSKLEYMYHTGKAIYFANRYHLEKYGRFIVDDRVIAMKNGPVMSGIYDMIKSARGEGGVYKETKEALAYFYPSKPNDLHRMIPKREADIDFLSDSDIECLDKAIEKIKGMGFKELEAFSHDDLYFTADTNDEISIDNIIEHSSNPKLLKEYLAG